MSMWTFFTIPYLSFCMRMSQKESCDFLAECPRALALVYSRSGIITCTPHSRDRWKGQEGNPSAFCRLKSVFGAAAT
jgi:hypothetical protein